MWWWLLPQFDTKNTHLDSMKPNLWIQMKWHYNNIQILILVLCSHRIWWMKSWICWTPTFTPINPIIKDSISLFKGICIYCILNQVLLKLLASWSQPICHFYVQYLTSNIRRDTCAVSPSHINTQPRIYTISCHTSETHSNREWKLVVI